MKVIIEYPVEHPIEVSVKVHEEHAFIAIKKYGDAYVKLKALGDISSNELINKNVSISKVIAIYMLPIDIILLKIYLGYQREKYFEEQLDITCTEAIDAMKKANLFDDLFVEFLKRYYLL